MSRACTLLRPIGTRFRTECAFNLRRARSDTSSPMRPTQSSKTCSVLTLTGRQACLAVCFHVHTPFGVVEGHALPPMIPTWRARTCVMPATPHTTRSGTLLASRGRFVRRRAHKGARSLMCKALLVESHLSTTRFLSGIGGTPRR